MSQTPSKSVRILICTECAPKNAQSDISALQTHLENSGIQISCEGQACMNACGEPTTIALQGDALATHVFTKVDIASDLDDISNTIGAWLQSPDGWIVDAHRCGRLRDCLKVRVPALKSGI